MQDGGIEFSNARYDGGEFERHLALKATLESSIFLAVRVARPELCGDRWASGERQGGT